MNNVIFTDLATIDFKEAWELQERFLQAAVNSKMANRNASHPLQQLPEHRLLFCEHPHVYTLGKSGHEKHLLVNDEWLKTKNATYYRINRGGDITYHGPGQLVGYPILDLDQFYNDIHLYLRNLEEVVIRMLAGYGIKGQRISGLTGVWIDADTKHARKICAYGVRCSRWVTMHGFALNVNPLLEYFNYIVPCGISDKQVTSMEKELGQKVDMEEVKERMLLCFSKVFNCIITKNQLFTEQGAASN